MNKLFEYNVGPKMSTKMSLPSQLIGRRALNLSVYRDADITGDCTRNGVSAQFNSLLVLCDEGPTIINGENYLRVVALVKHPVARLNCVHLVPVAQQLTQNPWFMAGGNYAGTSDSRFSDMVEALTQCRNGMVSVHDRVE